MDTRLQKVGLLGMILIAGLLISSGFFPSGRSERATAVSTSVALAEKEKTESDCLSEVEIPEDILAAQQETVSGTSLQLLEEREAAAAYSIQDFEIMLQMPELPTGCEITAMTMVLNYYGYPADKVEMATEYLPVVSANLYYGDDGLLYGPDLNRFFVGDPTTTGGYICGPEAIVTAANAYLADQESSLRAVDMTGASVDELYQMVREDTPVVVWVTISMMQRETAQGWYTEDGDYVDWSTNDHGAVLIGYTEGTVLIADPLAGIVEYDRQAFEAVFASRGNQCVVIQ